MMVLLFRMVMLPCSAAGDEHQGNAQYKQQDKRIIFHFQREQKVRYRERKKMLFLAETWKPNLARLSEMVLSLSTDLQQGNNSMQPKTLDGGKEFVLEVAIPLSSK